MLPHTVPGCPVVLLPWVCTLLQQLYTLLHVTLLDYFSVPYRFYSHFTLLHFYSGLKHQKVWGTLVSSVPNCPPLHLFVQATPLVTVRFHSSLWLSCSLPKLRPDLRLMFRVKKLLSNWEIYHANKFNSTPFKQNLMPVLVHSRSYCWKTRNLHVKGNPSSWYLVVWSSILWCWVPCDRVWSCIDNDPGDLETACSLSVCQKMTRAGVVTDPGDLSNDLLLTAQQEAAMASRDHTDAALSEFVSFRFYQN